MPARATASFTEAPASRPAALQPSAGPARRGRSRRIWVAVLLGSICLEGLARRFLPEVPAAAWYFLKDVTLLVGLLSFGIWPPARAAARGLFGPFLVPLALGITWTAIQALNPSQSSLLLSVVGFRSYWLWWLAPLVVAGALREERERRFAVMTVAALAILVAAMAALQFASPADALVNRYAWASDDPGAGAATVAETGRVRVSSTFSYLTGFTDFVVLVIPLLMAIGLGEGKGRLRALCFMGAGAIAVVLPMSGARSPAILVGLAVMAVFWSTGALATRKGWGIMAASIVFSLLPLVVSPDAVEGVRSRFESHDTAGRFNELLQLVPPYAILENQYPLFGLGTGMQHNLRFALGIRTPWVSEGEMGRYLIELGVVGYLLMWTLRLGLVLTLVRCARLLRRYQRRAMAGLCYALAGLTVMGNIVFDHVWQALYFTVLGLVLQAVAPLWVRERAGRGRGSASLPSRP